MRKFIHKIILLFSITNSFLIIFVYLYIKTDPYQDFGIHDNYSWKYFFQSLGDISTKKLVKNKKNYDSYIFGSSRTTGFYACYIQKKINKSNFFYYGNWNESIGGVYSKIDYINKSGNQIKNIFIILDTDYSFEGDGKAKDYDHYLITKTNKIKYLKDHFFAFFSKTSNLKILFGFKPKPKLFPNWTSDIKTNDVNHICSSFDFNSYGRKEILKSDSFKIDSLLINNFYNRQVQKKYLSPQISEIEFKMLQDIKSILTKNKTNYYIIIAPLYNQMKFNKLDSLKLVTVFAENIYDFSGVNEFTQNQYNYTDLKHFRDIISRQIIDSVLKK